MYTDGLIKEVKELYPDMPKMHELAEQGSSFLGHYLSGSWKYGIPLDEVLSCIDLTIIQEKARIEKRKMLLYKKWEEENRK